MRIKKKFTLIELLVVIAIIAVLVALLMPMVNKIRTRAVKTKAKAEMNSIATAVKSYEMTYGLLPVPNTGYSESEKLSSRNYARMMSFLTNVYVNSSSSTSTNNLTKDSNGNYNGRGIRFLDVPNDVDVTRVGFKDPWGKDFSVLLDTDYDGEITAGSPINQKLYGTIFLYTYVGDKGDDYVYSWK